MHGQEGAARLLQLLGELDGLLQLVQEPDLAEDGHLQVGAEVFHDAQDQGPVLLAQQIRAEVARVRDALGAPWVALLA